MKPASHSKKVLITGINGFTGIHLEKYLKEAGLEVFGTVLDTPLCTNHFQCDIRHKDEVHNILAHLKPNYIIHMAAISFVGESNTKLMYEVNILGAENILSALVESHIPVDKVILASSATVYGNQGKEVLDESLCPAPVNHYGISKLAMEHMAATYFDKLPILITRPFNYTGIGQENHFLIPKIIEHYAKKSSYIELGNLHVAREFNDIKNIIDAYYRLLLCDTSSSIVNLSSNTPVKLLDIIEHMNEIAQYKIDVRVNPAFVRANEIASLSGSTVKLDSIIEQMPKTSLETTLSSMYVDACNAKT